MKRLSIGIVLLSVSAVAVGIAWQVMGRRSLEIRLFSLNSSIIKLQEENTRLQKLRTADEERRRLDQDRIASLEAVVAHLRAKEAAPGERGHAAHPANGTEKDRFAGLLETEGPERTVERLAAACENRDLTALDVMNLVANMRELLVAGLNDRELPESFRSILIDSLGSVPDPLGLLTEVAIKEESSQTLSARMAAFVSDRVEADAEADPRASPIIKRFLEGNDMHGNKINLYPTLAQLASLGDAEARAAVDAFLETKSIYQPGIRALLDPPSRDEKGNDLRAAVIYSIQFNKGKWEDRPRQFQVGDIVVSIGGIEVRNSVDFHFAIRKFKSDAKSEADDGFVAATVYARTGEDIGSGYKLVSRELDPGDLRLMYGVRSIKRRG